MVIVSAYLYWTSRAYWPHFDGQMLKQEYEKSKMVKFVDIYGGNHAMFKHIYYWDKYLNPANKKQCIHWCDLFNYANEALNLIKKVRSEVIY
jgi:hypothetical protein